jgi:sugar lactone lactonase YvrE
MADPGPRAWVTGLGYPEALHWHGDRLWFSDFLTRRVSSVGRDGNVHPEAYVPGQPSGIGFLGADLLVVSSFDRKLLRFSGGRVTVHADLAGLANSPLNDMCVVPSGRAYVGTYGVETAYVPADSVGEGQVILVEPDGRAEVVATGLAVTNGIAEGDGGRRLLVAETRGCRIAAFEIRPDGTLRPDGLFADLRELHPDGLCVLEDGSVWVGCPFESAFVRVAEGGRIVETLQTPGRWAVSCVLDPRAGGLIGATARTTRPDLFRGVADGALELFDVAAAGG